MSLFAVSKALLTDYSRKITVFAEEAGGVVKAPFHSEARIMVFGDDPEKTEGGEYDRRQQNIYIAKNGRGDNENTEAVSDFVATVMYTSFSRASEGIEGLRGAFGYPEDDPGVIFMEVSEGDTSMIPFRSAILDIDSLQDMMLGGWKAHSYDSGLAVKDVSPDDAKVIMGLVETYSRAVGWDEAVNQETLDFEGGELKISKEILDGIIANEQYVDTRDINI